MITAKDIQRKKFEKVKFGYAVEEVEAFLAEVAEEMQRLEKSASESDEKIKLLAGKVREYKDTEDDLRNALIGAQKQAREVVEAANAKAAEIEAQARERVGSVEQQAIAEQEDKLKEVTAKLEQENAVLEATQRQVSEFKQTVFDMYRAHLASLAKLPELVKPTQAEAEKPAEPDKTAEAEKTEAEAEKPAAEAEKPAEQPAEPEKTEAEAEEKTAADEKPAEAEKPAPTAEDFEREAAEKAKAAAEAVRSGRDAVSDPFADGDRRSARNSGRRDDRKRRS
ncbi:MAG: DivIVA domain-containing protein [Oscillospiraceae bacterium]|nr:DivIVA domain-containing protein [Oscillospiraceae bacterium]